MLPDPNGHDRPRHATALMYHALDDGGDLRGQDPHYALAASTFRAHLDSIRRDTGGAGCARDWLNGALVGASGPASDEAHRQRVLLTFDDGHVSNHRVAFPMLVEYGVRADFFVNPVNVGQPGFASWYELRQMAAASMSIQSHGYDHRYLTHLTSTQLHESLRAARREIEDNIGLPVKLLAPPGGRAPADLPDIARECGYSHVLGSRPGRLHRGKVSGVLPRLAVTSELTAAEFNGWIAGYPGPIWRKTLRYSALALAKRLLGDRRYERARERALARHWD